MIFGIARRVWMISMVCGVLGISLATASGLAQRVASELPSGWSAPFATAGESLRGALKGLLPSESEEVRVQYVIDGDTFVAKVGEQRRKVRIIGVDTPESKKRGVAVQCYAKKAARFSESELQGERVKLTYDVGREDKYGRVLAYVQRSGKDFGRKLLAKGYARQLTIAPNLARAASYSKVEEKARKAQRGLWGACE